MRLDRRDLVWINVTTNPTAEWVARQITEAFPWDGVPGYMIRDRDRIYGTVVTRRLHAMGIRDKPTAPASPWQNGFAERLIGSIRRECLDHIIVLGEAHLRRVLKSYAATTTASERIGPKQGCACLSAGSAIRCHKFTRPFGWTSSPLRIGFTPLLGTLEGALVDLIVVLAVRRADRSRNSYSRPSARKYPFSSATHSCRRKCGSMMNLLMADL